MEMKEYIKKGLEEDCPIINLNVETAMDIVGIVLTAVSQYLKVEEPYARSSISSVESTSSLLDTWDDEDTL